MQRKYSVMVAASLGFFFVSATTFTSLGLVLYTMVAELGWSQASAGLSFSLLGLACGLSSPIPAAAIRLIGARNTLFFGAMTLVAAFLLASRVHGIGMFFVATSLMGIGYTLIAPAPAVHLLANWFPDKVSAMLGYYFMAGALGGVVGPPLVGAIVAASGDWRVHWMAMAGASVVLGVVFLLAVRDTAPQAEASPVPMKDSATDRAPQPAPAWGLRSAMRSRSFVVIAMALTVIQTVVTTAHAVLVTHMAQLGAGPARGAWAMSLMALCGTIAKGFSGRLAERWDPRYLLVVGLALQCLGFAALALLPVSIGGYLFALLLGTGWGLSWLSAHVLLVRYFGNHISGSVVAMATFITTLAIVGPYTAGLVDDHLHTFIPVFLAYTALLALVTVLTALLLRKPVPLTATASEQAGPDHVPTQLLGKAD